jgi:hypothetical protein
VANALGRFAVFNVRAEARTLFKADVGLGEVLMRRNSGYTQDYYGDRQNLLP